MRGAIMYAPGTCNFQAMNYFSLLCTCTAAPLLYADSFPN